MSKIEKLVDDGAELRRELDVQEAKLKQIETAAIAAALKKFPTLAGHVQKLREKIAASDAAIEVQLAADALDSHTTKAGHTAGYSIAKRYSWVKAVVATLIGGKLFDKYFPRRCDTAELLKYAESRGPAFKGQLEKAASISETKTFVFTRAVPAGPGA